MPASDEILTLRAVSKRFAGVQALDRASLSVRRGEIHGLVGENGAGKSTIIKLLAGVHARDGGEVMVDGARLDAVTPARVRAAGVRFVHQELDLVPHFTVAEAVFTGQEVQGRLGLRTRWMRARAEQVLREVLHADLSGRTLVRDLGTAQRKLVQIARALVDEAAKVLVLDEPTAPLTSAEIDHLFAAIARLKARGISLVYVSHYLGEITRLCDRVTVLRNGRDVGVLEQVTPADARRIIQLMVGREVGSLYPERRRTPAGPMLRLEGLGRAGAFRGVDLEVRRGEVVGVAGLVGSGREELVNAVYGLAPPGQGRIWLEGAPVRLSSPAAAVAQGVVLVPRDRRRDGLVLDQSVADNVNLASLEQVSRGPFVDPRAAAARAGGLARRLDIRPAGVDAPARELSGGNQQKTVLARWIGAGARLYVLDEPTVGVDVGARAQLYLLIEELARSGAAVLVSSSDCGELLGLCDRVAVLLRGELVATVEAAGCCLDRLVALTTGGAAREAA